MAEPCASCIWRRTQNLKDQDATRQGLLAKPTSVETRGKKKKKKKLKGVNAEDSMFRTKDLEEGRKTKNEGRKKFRLN